MSIRIKWFILSSAALILGFSGVTLGHDGRTEIGVGSIQRGMSPTARGHLTGGPFVVDPLDTLPSPGLTIGVTTFDGQFHHSQGRQVGHIPGSDIVHFVWTSRWLEPDDPNADWKRRGHYCSYNLSTGTLLQGFDGAPFTISEACAGYASIASGEGNDALAVLHKYSNFVPPYATWASYFPSSGSGFNTDVELTPPPELGAAMWPRVEAQYSAGAGDVFHIIARGPNSFIEYDCPWPATANKSATVWEAEEDLLVYWRFDGIIWQGPAVVDSTATLGYVLAADGSSDKSAIVLHVESPEGSTAAIRNVAYYESATGGLGWLDGSELGPAYRSLITNYSDTLGPEAWVHLAAAYDNGGTLHVIWDELRSRAMGSQNALRHWNNTRGTRATVALGYWDNPAANGGFDLNLSKMTLGIGDGSTTCTGGPGDQSNRNYLYVVYTQFGGPTPAEKADHSKAGFMNGELYLAVSRNQGNNWSLPENLTNTKMPDCRPLSADSVCLSEHWASLAKAVDDIHILYILDFDAGDQVIGETSQPFANDGRTKYLRLPGGGVDAPSLCPDSIITCMCVCHGDPRCDGEVNVLDVVTVVDAGFRGGPEMSDPHDSCPANATDVDCDGDTDVFDVVRFVNVAFRNEVPDSNFCDPCAP